MGTISTLNVKMTLDASDFENGIKKAGSSAESLVDRLSKLGGAMTGAVTVPLLAVGAAAMKMGTDLNASMANIGSLGVDTSRLKEMKDDILNISIETGKTALDVADGMYQVVSAFGDGADSLKILRINAKAATAGLSTLPEAIALTSAVTKGWNDTSAAAVLHVADLALKTVELGQTTFPELATSLQQVTLLTAGLGISQEEMFAAMAAGVGTMGSASEVAVKLRGAEQALMKPNADMIAAFKSIGVTSGQALIAQKGLGGAMLALKGYADKSGNSLTNMFGSIEGLAFAMYMSGAGADAYADKLEKLGGASGKLDSAFQAQMGGINASGAAWEQAQRKVEAFLIKLQDGIAPAVSAMITALTPMLDQLIVLSDQFAKMDPGLQAWVIGGFALLAALGPLLMILPGIVSAVGALSGAVAALSGPVVLAIATVALLGAAWSTNFGGIQEKTAAAVEAMRPYFDQLLEWMGVLNGGSMPAPKLPKLPAATLAPTGNAVAGLQGISGMLDQIDTSATNASDSVAILVGWISTLSALPMKAMKIDVGLAQKRGDFVVKVVMDFSTATAQIAAWAALQAQNAWAVSVGIGMNFANATNQLVAWVVQQTLAMWQVSVGVGMNFANATNQLVAWVALQAQSAVTLYAAWEPASLATLRLGVLQLFQTSIDIMASWAPDVLGALWNALESAIQPAVATYAVWGDGQLEELWNNLCDGLSRAVPIAGDWLGGTLDSMFDAAYEFFMGKTVQMNVAGNWSGPGGGAAGGGGSGGFGSPAAPGSPMPQARGGPVSSGVPYLIGERGAELFVPNAAGTIIPNDMLGAMAGGVTINNYGDLNNAIDLNALAWQVAQVIKRRN